AGAPATGNERPSLVLRLGSTAGAPVASPALFLFDSVMTRAAALFLLLASASPATAHPLPNTRYDRTVAVRVAADGVIVKYTLEVSQFTIWTDGAKLFTPAEIANLDRTARGFVVAYA